MAVRHTMTSFRNGLNLADPAGAGGRLPVPTFTGAAQGWKVFHENFNDAGLKEAVVSDNGNGWDVTETNATPTFSNLGLLYTLGGADNDAAQTQWENPSLVPLATAKDYYIEARFAVTGASGADTSLGAYFVGFTSDQQTTNFVTTGDAAWLFDDGIGFGGLTGRTETDAIIRSSDSEQTIGLNSEFMSTTQTFHSYGLYYDSRAGQYVAYVDGVEQGVSAAEAVLDNAALGACVYLIAGEAKANTINVQYITAAFEL